MMSEDDIAYKLSRDETFRRGILGPINYAAFVTGMSGKDGEDLIIVTSILKRAIELYIETSDFD